MSGGRPAPAGFWTTLRLLLLTARKRAVGRRLHQMKLWRARSGRKGWSMYETPWGLILSVAFCLLVHASAAWVVTGVVGAGERIDAEKAGLVAADDWFIRDAGLAVLPEGSRRCSDPSRSSGGSP